MVKYKSKEEIAAVRALRRIMNNADQPERLRKNAKQVLGDKKLFQQFVLLKKQKDEEAQQKKILDDRKKNLTGLKKWFISILPRFVNRQNNKETNLI